MNRNRTRGRIGSTPLIVLAAFSAAIGLWAGSRWIANPSIATVHTAIMYPMPQAVADFELVRADGRLLTLADLRGRWTIMFFGFTHCPDICPTTLAVFKRVWAALAAQGKTERVQFAFISVDPERDTAEKLASYVGFFNSDFIAATGSDEQLTRLTRSLGLVYARTPDSSDGYSVDHSASAVIIDPTGRRAGLFRPPFEAGPIATDILTLAESR